ncbi:MULTISPECIES: MDR family MFS transporter [Labrys]|uniref:MDR family MFS transporter n=1 Tax=Labrys TaxID=204476 RepID=UPI0008370837|nr:MULTISPECIES: MDR family MFS transporter [unclassified Labrys (in: a-proteobacteria)]MDZ5449416.1 MDR family MFS transporter [Labrys sp. ZIDIC5]OCC04322.1 MFS transporter [Labrys sp. WJW]
MTQSEPASSALSPHEIRSIIIGVLVAMFLAALDQTIVATAMPTIGRVLGDFENLPWVVTIYLLTSTAVTPLYGKMADIAGRRVTLLVAIGTFVAGSILCALAPTMLTLILARALQGLGGGGLISLAQTIIADIIPPRERARYQAYFATVFVSSSIAGPVLGGFMAEKLHWSVIFWINLPLGLLAFWMTNSVLKKLPRHERPHRLDFLGSALMAVATIALLLALSLGGPHYAWNSAPILGLFGLSVLFWVGFIIRLRTAPEPLIPTEILANPVVAAGTIAACFGMGVFIGMTIYMPILLEGVYGLTASQSGLALIPMMVGTVTGATLSGRLMARITHYKRPPLIGLAVSTVAFALISINPQALPLVVLEILLTLASLGIGTMLPVTTVAIQNAVLQHQMGTATGAMNFFRSLGGALIVAVFGAIVMGGLPADLAANVTIETLAKSIAAAGSDIGSVFRWVFLAAAFGSLATLCALLRMEERPLRTKVEPASVAME